MVFKEFPNIDFEDETQVEFDLRMEQVKKRWVDLDRQLSYEDRQIRLKRNQDLIRETKELLDSLPDLLDWIDDRIPAPDEETEKRWAKVFDQLKERK